MLYFFILRSIKMYELITCNFTKTVITVKKQMALISLQVVRDTENASAVKQTKQKIKYTVGEQNQDS